MTIEINGMAHVILTVSQFEIARDFYRKLLPQFGMKPVFDGDKFFYCVGGRTAIGIELAVYKRYYNSVLYQLTCFQLLRSNGRSDGSMRGIPRLQNFEFRCSLGGQQK